MERFCKLLEMSSTFAPPEERNEVFTINILRRTRIAPSGSDGMNAGSKDSKGEAGFREILAAAVLIGFVVPRSLWTTKRRFVDRFLKIWNIVIVYARTSALLYFFYFNSYFWPSLSMQISFDIQLVLGYVLIWLFMVQNKIKKSLKTLRRLLPPACNSDDSKDKSFVKVKLFLVALLLAAFSWTASEFFYFRAWSAIYERFEPLFNFTGGSQFIHYLTWLEIFCFILSYYGGAGTLYVLALLCAHSYRSCGGLLSRYGKGLEKDARRGPLTIDVISKKQSEFKELALCVKEVDEALNLVAFALYGFLMNDMFNTLSAAYSRDSSHGSVEYKVFLALKALTASTMFLYLTYSGSSVAEEKLALQKMMIRISSLFMKNSPCLSVSLSYESLYSTIKEADLSITILDLFDIKKTLILQAAGFYCTYGVYMFQFVTAPIA